MMVDRTDPLFRFLVAFAEVKLGPELGRGAFGVVHKATLHGDTIACKMLSKEIVAELDQEQFLKEARTMSTIPQHPNVIRLVGLCRDEKICILSGE
jgi:serine/threonine protein kinase